VSASPSGRVVGALFAGSSPTSGHDSTQQELQRISFCSQGERPLKRSLRSELTPALEELIASAKTSGAEAAQVAAERLQEAPRARDDASSPRPNERRKRRFYREPQGLSTSSAKDLENRPLAGHATDEGFLPTYAFPGGRVTPNPLLCGRLPSRSGGSADQAASSEETANNLRLRTGLPSCRHSRELGARVVSFIARAGGVKVDQRRPSLNRRRALAFLPLLPAFRRRGNRRPTRPQGSGPRCGHSGMQHQGQVKEMARLRSGAGHHKKMPAALRRRQAMRRNPQFFTASC